MVDGAIFRSADHIYSPYLTIMPEQLLLLPKTIQVESVEQLRKERKRRNLIYIRVDTQTNKMRCRQMEGGNAMLRMK